MSGSIHSFDGIVAEVMKNRPRSDFSWHGKVEIRADEKLNVRVLLFPPGELLEFDRNLNSNDLVLCNHSREVRVEQDEHRITIYAGNRPSVLTRFSKLDPRLVETFLTPKYRQRLLDGLIAQDPEAMRWAILHGLLAWRQSNIVDSTGDDWQQAVPAYVPFEYEKRLI